MYVHTMAQSINTYATKIGSNSLQNIMIVIPIPNISNNLDTLCIIVGHTCYFYNLTSLIICMILQHTS